MKIFKILEILLLITYLAISRPKNYSSCDIYLCYCQLDYQEINPEKKKKKVTEYDLRSSPFHLILINNRQKGR